MTPKPIGGDQSEPQWTYRDLAAAADVPLWFAAAFASGSDLTAHFPVHLAKAREAIVSLGIFKIANPDPINLHSLDSFLHFPKHGAMPHYSQEELDAYLIAKLLELTP